MMAYPRKIKRYLDTEYLSAALALRRYDDRLSFRDVSKQTKVSASALCRIEHNIGCPDFNTVMAILEWLGSPLSDFLLTDEDS
jgi:transcriptional regulator with XRE-family HTH domain